MKKLRVACGLAWCLLFVVVADAAHAGVLGRLQGRCRPRCFRPTVCYTPPVCYVPPASCCQETKPAGRGECADLYCIEEPIATYLDDMATPLYYTYRGTRCERGPFTYDSDVEEMETDPCNEMTCQTECHSSLGFRIDSGERSGVEHHGSESLFQNGIFDYVDDVALESGSTKVYTECVEFDADGSNVTAELIKIETLVDGTTTHQYVGYEISPPSEPCAPPDSSTQVNGSPYCYRVTITVDGVQNTHTVILKR